MDIIRKFLLGTCQENVPEAITAFPEGDSFEDVLRSAISLGGDRDMLTCIADSIAEAFCGMPEELTDKSPGTVLQRPIPV